MCGSLLVGCAHALALENGVFLFGETGIFDFLFLKQKKFGLLCLAVFERLETDQPLHLRQHLLVAVNVRLAQWQ